jgi:N4-gp56 family major capsid protein
MADTLTTTINLSETVLTVYSKDISFHAQPVLRYAQFATKKTELGTSPGLEIIFTRYDNLAKGGKLTEGQRMTTQALSASQLPIKVFEYGNAISVSEYLLQSSFDDTLASGARLLGLDYADVLDCELRDAVLKATSTLYARKSNGDKVATRDTLDDTCVFSSAVIKDAVEVLATKKVRKYNGDSFICFLHPHQVRGLRDDPDFKNATDYGAIYAGELGRINDVVFIETTQQPVIEAGGVGAHATLDVYQAVIFGDNAYGLATSLPVEMRDGGVIDFGREHALAWYSIFGAGILEDENILIIESV